jgi:uncharacterized protein (DUF433 family)
LQIEIGKYLVSDPEICHGKITFKGTRVWLSVVLAYLGKGHTVEDILRNWPELSREAVEEALHLAARVAAAVVNEQPLERLAA